MVRATRRSSAEPTAKPWKVQRCTRLRRAGARGSGKGAAEPRAVLSQAERWRDAELDCTAALAANTHGEAPKALRHRSVARSKTGSAWC